jgi:transcriptional regulator with XRE-family HTH domain
MVITAEPVGTEADMSAVPTLARRLRELREARELSQQALAVAAGLSVSIVSQIEQGKRENPRVKTVLALAEALGVGVGQLLARPARRPGRKKRKE